MMPSKQSGHYRDTMTPEQEAHLARVKARFLAEVDAKYRAGVREHGGNLWERTKMDLIRELKAEAVDLYVYAQTLEDDLHQD
jgi:hypothetical protein